MIKQYFCRYIGIKKILRTNLIQLCIVNISCDFIFLNDILKFKLRSRIFFGIVL